MAQRSDACGELEGNVARREQYALLNVAGKNKLRFSAITGVTASTRRQRSQRSPLFFSSIHCSTVDLSVISSIYPLLFGSLLTTSPPSKP